MASKRAESVWVDEGAAPSVRVQLFGCPRVIESSAGIQLSPHQLGLVALVYGHGQDGLGRGRVARLLWNAEDGSDVRHRIRQLLVEIRAKIGSSVIDTHGDELRALPRVACDLRDFEMALDRGDLRVASAHCSRGFCTVTPSGLDDAFLDWRGAVNERLVRTVRSRASAKWSRAIQECDWSGARDAAEALYELDPSDQMALENVLEVLGRDGDLEAAERVFAAHLETCDDGSAPNPAIERAFERVRKRSRGLRSGPTDDQPAPLIGRRDALQAARGLFEDLADGRFGFVLVSGESGIGKTRLLQELRREALVRDIRCLSARAVELEQRIPLNPLLDALSAVDLRPHLTALGRPWSAVIGAVLPAGTLGEPPEELPPIQDAALPRRLLDAIFLLLERLASEEPTILFVDDLQWADATTVAALQFVQRRWTKGPLGVMATLRPELVAQGDPVAKYLSRREDLTIRRIELRELSHGEAMQLVRHISQGSIGEGRSRQICELACLHPLYLTEITRDYIGGRLKIPEQPTEPVSIPVSLEQILASRVQNLSGRAMKLAGFLAVAARPMRITVLAVLADMGVDDATDAVEELRRARLADTEHDKVCISHDLFRSAIYRHIGELRRSMNHRALAAHLLSESGDEAAGELAIHYARAGESALAAQYGWMAAGRAMETGTVAEAAHFYQLITENEPLPSRRADAMGGLARALHLGRDITRANPALELAAAALRAVDKPQEALRLEIKRVEGLAEVGAAPITALVERLTQLKAEATRSADWEAVALALDVELHLLHRAGNVQGIRSLFEEMREVAKSESREARLLAKAGLALGVLYDNPDEALHSAQQAVGLAAETRAHRLVALTRLLVVLQYRGMLELPQSRQLIDEARALAERSGDLLLRFSIESNLAIAALDAGDVERAEVLMVRSTSLLGSADMNLSRFHEASHRAELAMVQRDFQRAKTEYQEASRYLGDSGPWYVRETVAAGLGLCALETGDLAEARRREAEMPGEPKHWYFDPSIILAFKARLLDRRGRHMEALELLEAAAGDIEHRLVFAWFKVRAMQARLMMKRGSADPKSVALEAYLRAENLCLIHRMREFGELIAALT